MTNLNYQALSFWFGVANSVGLAVIGVIGWWNLREKAANNRLLEAEKRLAKLESDVKHPPACTYHPLLEERIDKMRAGLEEKISAVNGDTREIKGSVNGLATAVDLMNEYLINQGGRR